MTAPNQNMNGVDLKTDELVGSLFFRAIVTVSLTQTDVSHGLLKLNISRFMQLYDYHAAEQHLRTIGVDRVWRVDSEPRKAVFQLLGFICRSFPTSSSYNIMHELLRFGRGDLVVGTMNSTNGALSDTFTGSQDNQASPRYESQPNGLLPRYTSILNEEGQRRDVIVRRKILVLSLDPPQMKVTVSFGALEATGIGRNKKIACHIAAKNICDKLNFII